MMDGPQKSPNGFLKDQLLSSPPDYLNLEQGEEGSLVRPWVWIVLMTFATLASSLCMEYCFHLSVSPTSIVFGIQG